MRQLLKLFKILLWCDVRLKGQMGVGEELQEVLVFPHFLLLDEM